MPKFAVPNVFAQIISGYDIDDPEKHKPHPYMLQEIMRTQKVGAEETVYVGDAKKDVQMARNANVRPIVVLTGLLSRKQAEALGVKDIIPTVSTLDQVL